MENELDAVFSILKNHKILARELTHGLHIGEPVRIDKRLKVLVYGEFFKQAEVLARSVSTQINELTENVVCSVENLGKEGFPAFLLEIVVE